MLKIAVLVLAGGKAKRMGGNKAFAAYEGAPLITHVLRQLRTQSDCIWINSFDQEMAVHPLLTSYETFVDADEFANLGPLSGVLTGLVEAERRGLDGIVTTPCDMPNIPVTMVRTLSALAVVKPDHHIYFKGMRDYPLCAFWPLSLRPLLQNELMCSRDKGGLAVMKFVNSIPHHSVFTDDEPAFVNINAL